MKFSSIDFTVTNYNICKQIIHIEKINTVNNIQCISNYMIIKGNAKNELNGRWNKISNNESGDNKLFR